MMQGVIIKGLVNPTKGPFMDSQSVVYVVDDDPDARHVLVTLAESMFHKTEAFADAADFLKSFDERTPSCLVTDMRMRGMSGLDLLRTLKASGKVVPTIIVTGYAETAVAVDAMLTGAVTFLEKSTPPHKICEAIARALSLSETLLEQKAERDRVLQISDSLSEDERQILKLVAAGRLNKEIAFEIGIPLRTLEDRKRRLMTKVNADSVADLIRFSIRVEEFEHSTAADLLWNQRNS